MSNAPVSYAYSMQKPTAQIQITQIPEKLMAELPSIVAYMEECRAAGRYSEHMAYSNEGQAVVNRNARNSLRILPDFRPDLQWHMEQTVRQYWQENFYASEERLMVCTQSELFYYPPGIGILLHTDDHVMTTTGVVIGEDLYRGITSLLYLNNDFEGGEIVFPEQGLTLKPEPGQLVVFPSNKNFPHLVRPITSGARMSFQRVYGLATADGEYRPIANALQSSCC